MRQSVSSSVARHPKLERR